MAENYVLLETIELSQSASSITFDNIPQTGYTDLKIVLSGRSTTTTTGVQLTFNGSSSTYTQKRMYGAGSGTPASDSPATSYIVGTMIVDSSYTASIFGNGEFYIPNYTSANHKSVSCFGASENNATAAYMSLTAGLWSTTSAITSVTLTPSGGSFTQYSTFSLYAVAKLNTTPVTAPFATGGNIVANDGTYWYHAFLSSGTFTPLKALTCDYLVVAGGGAGGWVNSSSGGGGGAGGLRSTVTATGGGGSLETALSLLSGTGYTVTIGGGGASRTSQSAGGSGSNSVFSTITSTGGGGGGGATPFNGLAGGSGGGSHNAGVGGTGTANQGYAGGVGAYAIPRYAMGGGGGAGAVGANGGNGTGNGGAGVAIPTFAAATNTGVSNYYAGGGGGGADEAPVAAGGAGGGGAGSDNAVSAAVSGTANTGGGGGGDATASPSGAGGSGIVIVRYAMV